MTAEESPYRRHRRTVIYGAVIAAGWLAFTGLFGIPLSPPTPSDEGAPASMASTRQQVVIFVVDTQDAFDTHGAQVRSVIQRQCPLCTTRPINLHGDLSARNIVQALLHVDDLSRQYDAATTLLVNVSLGSYAYDEILHTQVRRMRDASLIFVAAAGNDDRDDPFYPAALPEVIGVCSSTRHSREKAAYSNYGPWISLCAPGWQFVRSPLQMGMASGTSFASPMVAGFLGQLLLDAPCATPRTGLKALTRTADPVAGSGQELGAGILNPSAAEHYMQTLHAATRSTNPGSDSSPGCGVLAPVWPPMRDSLSISSCRSSPCRFCWPTRSNAVNAALSGVNTKPCKWPMRARVSTAGNGCWRSDGSLRIRVGYGGATTRS